MIIPIIEDWKVIDNTQGLFVVSDRGRIGQRTGNDGVYIVIDVDSDGMTDKRYKTVWLCGVKYYVHRLVAEYFLSKPERSDMSQVHHRDHNCKHNCVVNLEWTTVDYNNKLRTWDKQYEFNWEALKYERKENKT